MGVNVYLAARFARKEELKRYAAEGNRIGVFSTSRWLYESHDVGYPEGYSSQDYARWAQSDLDDIQKAEAFILFTGQGDPFGSPSLGGMNVELGFAVALRKRIFIVWPLENIFHHLGGIYHFKDWADALEFLRPKNEYEQPGFHENVETNPGGQAVS